VSDETSSTPRELHVDSTPLSLRYDKLAGSELGDLILATRRMLLGDYLFSISANFCFQ
jgi:hypothetical protein